VPESEQEQQRIIVFGADLVPDGRERAVLEELLGKRCLALARLSFDDDEESRRKIIGKVSGDKRMSLNRLRLFDTRRVEFI